METPGDARDSFFSSIFFAGFAYDVSVITILLRELEADNILKLRRTRASGKATRAREHFQRPSILQSD